jgi:pimeloyl-ACP methyl ester carboxylesterase
VLRFQLTEGNILITIGDQAVQGGVEMDGLQVTEDEVLPAEGLSRVRLRYLRDTLDIRRVFDREIERDSERGPLHGRTVIGHKTGEQWAFRLASGRPDADQSAALVELAGNYAPVLYPSRRMRIGESWEVGATSMKRWLGHDLIRSDGRARLTFRGLAEFSGERCAVIDATIDAVGQLEDPDGNLLELRIGLEGTIYRSLESHLDLTGTMEGLMVLEGELEQDGTAVAVKVIGPIKVTATDRLRPAGSATSAAAAKSP